MRRKRKTVVRLRRVLWPRSALGWARVAKGAGHKILSSENVPITVLKQRENERGKSMGFVRCDSPESANQRLSALARARTLGLEFNGSCVWVSVAAGRWKKR